MSAPKGAGSQDSANLPSVDPRPVNPDIGQANRIAIAPVTDAAVIRSATARGTDRTTSRLAGSDLDAGGMGSTTASAASRVATPFSATDKTATCTPGLSRSTVPGSAGRMGTATRPGPGLGPVADSSRTSVSTSPLRTGADNR